MEKEELKNIAQLFIDYDGDVQVNPFAKVHWGMIKDSLKNGKLYIDDNRNFGVIISEAKSNRGVSDFSRAIVGNIKKGDIIVKRFFYKKGYRDNVIDYISNMRKSLFGDRDVWFTHINMEHKLDRDVVETYNATWLSSKIDAVAAEIRGIYYSGEHKQKGLRKYEDIPCCKIDYPLLQGLDNFVNELNDFQNWGVANHQKVYGGPEKTWTAMEVIPLEVIYGSKRGKEGLRGKLNEEYIKRFSMIEKILNPITTLDDCLWLAITKVFPKKGVVSRHSDKGIDKMNAGIQVGKTARIHYCLQSNTQTMFEVHDLKGNNHLYHMKSGEYWYMDKRKPHAVYNKGETYRYHMIFDMKITQNVLDKFME